ncbi:hypothetical protein PSTT_01952 [Puccinia striiformis]|uniref:Uncharacterized protein n=1 Tax=Puccinia striiformis TaxID=27350 RepID=A0A2S4W1W6_9BASI|nr:hypothetical protein PSTT_01952 [Puccinia striiformis]
MVPKGLIAWLCVLPQLLNHPVLAIFKYSLARQGNPTDYVLLQDATTQAAGSSMTEVLGFFKKPWNRKSGAASATEPQEVVSNPLRTQEDEKMLARWLVKIYDQRFSQLWLQGTTFDECNEPAYYARYVYKNNTLRKLKAQFQKDLEQLERSTRKHKSLPKSFGSETKNLITTALDELSGMSGTDSETGVKIAHCALVFADIAEIRPNGRNVLNNLVIAHISQHLDQRTKDIDSKFKSIFRRLKGFWNPPQS